LEILLERGRKAPPKLCTSCKSIPEDGYERGELVNPGTPRIPCVTISIRSSVVVYRPGDPGFAERAAVVAPPRTLTRYPEPFTARYLYEMERGI
jgi:hypothetical protein